MAETPAPDTTVDSDELPYPFADLDEPQRTELVRAALHDNHAVSTSWHVRELYGFGHGSRIYRASGTAVVDDTSVPWSLVIKSFVAGADEADAASAEVTAWDYWKREWLAYQAPWMSQLHGKLSGPELLGTGDDGERSAWVGLEDLSACDRRPWTLAHFVTAAQHLGAFQAPYLLGEELPSDPWLSADRLRGWTEQAASVLPLLSSAHEDGMTRKIFPPSTVARLLELWRARDTVYEALAALPGTLCHGDYYPRNLFFRPTPHGDQSIAIDWASCGRGVIGEDLSQLVDFSLVWFEADLADAAELETRCLAGYLDGLRSAGWAGDPEEVLLGYLGADVLSIALGGLAPTLMTTSDPSARAEVERAFGRSMSAYVTNLRGLWARQEGQISRLWQLLGLPAEVG